MAETTQSPSVAKDLGVLADLYRTVFWMVGQRIQHGKYWQKKLEEDVLTPGRYESEEREEVHARN